jgi:glucosamine-phosphate N-acetyltransferase
LLSANCENIGLQGIVLTDHSIHNLGMVGHIEDIAVLSDQRGKKLGKRLIEALDSIAEKVGCYKVCSQKVVS